MTVNKFNVSDKQLTPVWLERAPKNFRFFFLLSVKSLGQYFLSPNIFNLKITASGIIYYSLTTVYIMKVVFMYYVFMQQLPPEILFMQQLLFESL